MNRTGAAPAHAVWRVGYGSVMGRVRSGWLVLACAAAGVAVLATAAAIITTASAHQDHSTSVAAEDTVATAIEMSRLAHPDQTLGALTTGGVDEVLVGRADLFSDTLAAGSATGRPVLLTPSDHLDERTAAELDRLDPDRVTLAGGEEALSPRVEAELDDRGFAVSRLAGATRVETALAIARHHHPRVGGTPVVVARATGDGTRAFADTLGGSALAHTLEAPVVLTPTDRLHPGVAEYLRDADAAKVVLAGGTAAISAHVAEQIESLGITVRRAGGASRASTAISQNAVRGFDRAGVAESVLLLDGYDDDAWASGFAGGAWAADTDTAVVLATGERFGGMTSAFLGGAAATDLVCAPTLPATACEAAQRAMDLPPFAETGGITLRQPSTTVEMIGFHESNHDGAQQLEVAASAPPTRTLDSRDRPTGSRSSADIVAHPDRAVRAPVSGTVERAGTYRLYCDYHDDYVVIDPDDHPGWEVKLLHIDGVRVHPGDRVEAGTTVLAPRPTQLPFESQVDRHSANRDWPHVHLEVIDPSIPDEPSGSC